MSEDQIFCLQFYLIDESNIIYEEFLLSEEIYRDFKNGKNMVFADFNCDKLPRSMSSSARCEGPQRINFVYVL